MNTYKLYINYYPLVTLICPQDSDLAGGFRHCKSVLNNWSKYAKGFTVPRRKKISSLINLAQNA